MLAVRWIDAEEVFGRWREPWGRLLAEADNATPFQTPEWNEIWLRHFGGRKRPTALAAFEGDDLVGWWPMTRTAGAWPVLRPMAKGPSDYLHPLVRSGALGVGKAMAEALAEVDTSLIDLHQLRDDFAHELVAHLPVEPIPQAVCLVLDLDRSYDAYVQSLGKSLRYDVRRLEKPPFADGSARIEIATDATLLPALDHLFRLHAMRWRRRWQPGAFPAPLRRFHMEWATCAQAQGRLELSVLIHDDAPIGALYVMRVNESAYYYQAGMDPAQNSISPGTLLVASAIRRAIERGDRTFDFLRGDESYKRRWKPQRNHTNARYLIAGSGLRPTAGRTWNRFGSRLEARLRARLEAR